MAKRMEKAAEAKIRTVKNETDFSSTVINYAGWCFFRLDAVIHAERHILSDRTAMVLMQFACDDLGLAATI